MVTIPGRCVAIGRLIQGTSLSLILSLIVLCFPKNGTCKIFIDIDGPSVQKFQIAVPDFRDLSRPKDSKGFSGRLNAVVSNDLELTGYFSLIDKRAFLMGGNDFLTLGDIRFKDWSVIGAELLLYGAYVLTGKGLEIEMRLFDVFTGRQVLGKRVSGDTDDYRYLVHRLSNEIIVTLTGHKGIFLTKLAFVSDASGHKEIYRCDYDGHNVRQVTHDNVIAILPRLSPDGKKMTYTSYKEGGAMLYMMDLYSGITKKLSGRSGMNSGVSWLPGTNQFALTMSRNENPDIYMMDLNGKVLKRLINYWGIDASPSFSPDGKRIAFVSDRSGSPQIYILERDSGKIKRLTYDIGRYNTSPAWSCLNRIAFVSLNEGRLDIFSMDPNGRRLRRLTDNQGKNEDPCWSPDGRYMVFSSNREGSYKLFIMNANGQNQRKITSFSGNHVSPSWAP